MKNRRWLWLLAGLVLAPVLLCVGLGLLPVTGDPVLAPEQIVVGARAGEAGATAVDVEFPPLVEPEENPSTPEKVELGHLLFFDPVLSAENDISCATCHHPDLGLSDGRATSMGAGGRGVGVARADGETMARNAPSLYEVAYVRDLFWDGRVQGLEAQAETPLTLATEMHADLDETVAELLAIDEYQTLFAAAFPEAVEPVSYENVARALAAFQRTLIAHDSPFDRYAAGDPTALTPAQRRGFALFRSGATGCYKCHAAPTFTNGEFAITGVPNAEGAWDEDAGRAAVTGDEAERGAFRAPSLRNVALSAPYMHNGVFATLEEVLAFYAAGGGQGLGLEVPNQSYLVHSFDLSEQEQQDLVSFLYALTDESAMPAIPASVPSGLARVVAQENPARTQAAALNVGSELGAERAPTTLTVTPDQTIQSVVDQARDGDTIEIEFGTYHERVVVDQNDLTIRGIPNAAGEWPVLDGEMKFSDGIAASGNNFTVERLAVKNYKGNGIIVDGARGVVIRDVYVENTSLYGVYPVHATDVLVERVEATGIRDAGIYVGQSRDAVLRDNVVYGNVIGIEVENSINVEVSNNHAYDNSTGIFVDLLPQLDSKVSLDTRVHDNLLEDNNFGNFAQPGEIGELVPEGTGILILGGDDVQVYDNTIRDNRTVGVAVFSSATAFSADELDIGPNPERVHVHGNEYSNNGYDAAEALRELGLDGADVIWDVSNWDNRFDESGVSTFPPLLPGSGWPSLARRAYWQVLNFVVQNLG